MRRQREPRRLATVIAVGAALLCAAPAAAPAAAAGAEALDGHARPIRWPPMIERFADRGRRVVVFALEEAASLGHDHIGTEHILLGLLRGEDDIAAQVLGSLTLTRDRVRTQVARIAAPRGAVTSGEIAFTPRTEKALQLALDEASSLSHRDVETAKVSDLLLAVPRFGRVRAGKLLNLCRISPSRTLGGVPPRQTAELILHLPGPEHG